MEYTRSANVIPLIASTMGKAMTLKSEQRSGTLVVPGERLGVIEEFIPDSGTYVKDGVIYSKIIGRALMDMLNRRVSVYPLAQGAVVPKVGVTVLGQVGTLNPTTFSFAFFKWVQRRKCRVSSEEFCISATHPTDTSIL